MPNLLGSRPEQVTPNGQLGGMAFQNPEAVVIRPQLGARPLQPGDMTFEQASATSLRVWVMDVDGTMRSATLTLA